MRQAKLITSAYYFLKLHLHHFSKIKIMKKSQNSKNRGLSYYFCLVIEGSESGSGSVPRTNGSGHGSGRPKNIPYRYRTDLGSATLLFYGDSGFSGPDPKTDPIRIRTRK
jgi:hypothetical protein